MNKVYYLLLLFLVRIHALLPLRLLYVISDFLYLIIYYIVGYRRKVVYDNLKQCFPEKSTKERVELEKRFYHHFCDIIIESLKQAHISQEELLRRTEIKNIEMINEWMKTGRSCILILGHYGNWEWFSSINFRIAPFGFGGVYRQLKSEVMDKLLLQIRSAYGAITIEKNQTLRELMQYKRDNKPVMISFLSDQTPSANNLHYWTTFLNRETSILVGAERIAKKLDFDVIYLDIQKVSRGKYAAEFKLITDNPKATAEFEITEKYARLMEETILRDPAYWLWSHKRWKHQR